MAFTHINLAVSLLLLSSLAIASVGAYDSYDSSVGDYQPKPNEGEANPTYAPSSDVYKRKPEESKPDYNNKPQGEGSYGYDKKPDKPEVERKSSYTQPEDEEKPNYESLEVNKPLSNIGVEGLVLCKLGSKYYPISGALAKVTCQVDEYGVEKTLPICSVSTNAKGYFLATLSSITNKSRKLKDCKAFVERSPLEICKVASDVNKGITGAPFSSYRVLHDKNMKLYSVGPFFFTSETQTTPNNGY